MNAFLLETPEWLDADAILDDWDERRLALIQRQRLLAVLPIGIDPPKRKHPAKCLLWVRTHSGQTQHRRQIEVGGTATAAQIRPPKSVFLSRLAAESIRSRNDHCVHEAEYELVLPEGEDIGCLL